ncbi:hypothetical protein SUGI_0882040 [Cryptomeria japonica]|nr:hypothetical protein SUGI_0882040 [Cryptomeria japonica]
MDRKLYECALEGDVGNLKNLYSKDHEIVKDITPQGNTVLHIAAKRGHAHFVKEILGLEPELLKVANSKGDTALHEAARRGYADVVKELLNDKSAELLVDKDVEGFQTAEIEDLTNFQNAEKNTALHEAAKGGHGDVVSVLLKCNEDATSVVNQNGESPLYKACEEGHLKVVVQLFKSATSLTLERIHDNKTILHAALLGGHKDVAAYLLQELPKLAKSSDKFGSTPLHLAISREDEHVEIVQELLKADSSACYKFNVKGMTPLHIAAEKGHAHILQEILNCRPDCIELNDQKHKRNILHLAVGNEQSKVVRYLLRKRRMEMSELINEPDKEGNTPLHLATIKDSLEMVNLLLSPSPPMAALNLNLKAVNKAGHTALDLAQIKGGHSFAQLSIWKALRSAGCTHGEHLLEDLKENPTFPTTQVNKPTSNSNSADISLQKMAETLSVVAALIATVTFAAAFTVPGGLYQGPGGRDEEGTAVMINRVVFKVFVISDTVAMCSSMIVALILVWAVPGVPGLLAGAVGWGLKILWVALGGMVVTFVTAMYLVVAPKCLWLAVLVCILGSSTPFIVSPLVIDSAKRNVHKAGFHYEYNQQGL